VKKLSHFSRKEVQQFFASARSAFKSDALTVLIAPRTKDCSHLLVVASRKVGNACQRNKIKRRLRAIFYENKLYEKPGDLAIIVRKPATGLTFDELKTLILHAVPGASPGCIDHGPLCRSIHHY
jgi:ribonuclease P protein component